MAHTSGTTGENSHGLLKKDDLLTHPTPAATSPAHPESAKTASSPKDAPFPKQGRSERPTMVLPSLLVYVAQDGSDESPTAYVLSIPPVPLQG